MDNTTIHEKIKFIQEMRQYGDVPNVCKREGYSETVFWTAVNRTDGKYTVAEMKVILAMYREMQERQELRIAVGLTG